MDSSIGDIIQQQSQGQREEELLGGVLVRLEGRVESIEIKVMSLTKIVRLLQQYSEKKDQQYEKQTQNMAVMDAKVSRVDSLQSQLNQSLMHYEQLSVQYKTQNIKIDNINKCLQSINLQIRTLQDKINFDLSEISTKINQIQANMLQTIRTGSQPIKPLQDHPSSSHQYALEELTFRLSHLEAAVKSEHDKMKIKLDRLDPKNNKNRNSLDEDHYGLIGDRGRKSKSKSRGVDKPSEKGSLKRMKSK